MLRLLPSFRGRAPAENSGNSGTTPDYHGNRKDRQRNDTPETDRLGTKHELHPMFALLHHATEEVAVDLLQRRGLSVNTDPPIVVVAFRDRQELLAPGLDLDRDLARPIF